MPSFSILSGRNVVVRRFKKSVVYDEEDMIREVGVDSQRFSLRGKEYRVGC